MADRADVRSDASTPPERRRVFFALWPDAAAAAALTRATKRGVRLSGGRPTAKERLHVTVAFLGALTASQLELARGAAPIGVGPFDFTLDTLGVFATSRVLWLASRSPPPALLDLERRLWQALELRGFEREPRIYRPHLTLARRARAVDEQPMPVHWRVEELVLAESLTDGRKVHYEVLERWPL